MPWNGPTSTVPWDLNISFPSNIRWNGNCRSARESKRSPFWTSTPVIGQWKAYGVEFGTENDGFVSVWWYKLGKLRWMVIRCFKDDSDLVLVKYNIGDGTWSRESNYETFSKVNGEAEVILPAEKPILGWLVFDNWYMDDQYQNEFVDETPVSENITLYAKYKSAEKTSLDGILKETSKRMKEIIAIRTEINEKKNVKNREINEIKMLYFLKDKKKIDKLSASWIKNMEDPNY